LNVVHNNFKMSFQALPLVLKHYFQPGREAFRQALQSTMPKLLTNGQKTPKDEMRKILAGMTAGTVKRDKARLEQIIAAL